MTESVLGEARTGKGMILLLACAAQFIVVLDIAIVNVALPSIQQDLGIGQSTLQWIVIAYGLMLGGFLLLGGRMADLLGRRRVLMTGLVLFTAASLLAGLAESADLLIGARALQGFGAALIPPAALSILAVTFADGAERNKALGLYGAVAGLSASIGVIASGLLTDGPGWRWVFLINVPVGVLLIAGAAIFLPIDVRDRDRSEGFDVAGAVTAQQCTPRFWPTPNGSPLDNCSSVTYRRAPTKFGRRHCGSSATPPPTPATSTSPGHSVREPMRRSLASGGVDLRGPVTFSSHMVRSRSSPPFTTEAVRSSDGRLGQRHPSLVTVRKADISNGS